MTSVPHHYGIWAWALMATAPASLLLTSFLHSERAAAWVVIQATAAAAVALLVVGVYIVLVVGINGKPEGGGRDVMLWSLIAAVVAAILVPGARGRTVEWIEGALHEELPTTGEVVGTFGGRMSRAVPMDELLLQLVESLRETIPGTRAEVWTGTAAAMSRAVSVPTLPPATIRVTKTEETTITRARIGGPAWVSIWLPQLVPETPHGDYRVVPVAHLGELLGLVVVRRPPETPAFTDDDESALVELAHQLGLALHNVNLDSALQQSLEALAERNEELTASRLRIVATSDETRRTIERNLHDGAQQHLVALAVKVGIVKAIAEKGDPEMLQQMLDSLREDVQVTIQEVRELAHGIYPPLLRDKGLGDALRAAANRSPLPCHIDDELPGRYSQDVETAAYFCTLEAMQNAGKHAGEAAAITVTVRGANGDLTVAIHDTGAGFDPGGVQLSHGFVNMRDRLGALGGSLSVTSAPGSGTTVEAVIPAHPLDTA
jgi:signal transduction histidine kinase